LILDRSVFFNSLCPKQLQKLYQKLSYYIGYKVSQTKQSLASSTPNSIHRLHAFYQISFVLTCLRVQKIHSIVADSKQKEKGVIKNMTSLL